MCEARPAAMPLFSFLSAVIANGCRSFYEGQYMPNGPSPFCRRADSGILCKKTIDNES